MDPVSTQATTPTLWDEWPKWENDNEFSTKRFKFKASLTKYDDKTSSDSISILKDRQFIQLYCELFAARPRKIFEIGFFQGGMPLFIADMQEPVAEGDGDPLHIVGIDYWPPSEALDQIITHHELGSTIKLHGGILQDDVKAIHSILESEYHGQPLDLIIDDCSHQYNETKICFENFFSQLKPGGKYVIEDWGWQHWLGEPWQSDKSPFHGKPSMSNLIFELAMAMASRSDIVSRIDVVSSYCVVITRGPNPPQGEIVTLSEITKMAGRVFVPM
jgi:cephalosporin hydroxylase